MMLGKKYNFATIITTILVILMFWLNFRSESQYFDAKMWKIQQFESMNLEKSSQIFEKWWKCVIENYAFGLAPEKFWSSSALGTTKCVDSIDAPNSLKIQKFQNLDEDKYSILPVKNTSNDIFVTIGIGKDIKAELEYKKVAPQTRFFGADPIFIDNYELFSKIGSYFPLAIGASDGYSKASVLLNGTYQDFDVFHIDLIYFFKNILKISIIENLWLDNEYAEYDILPYFYKNGQLDKAGITICQINIEIHVAENQEQYEKFKNFFWNIVNDRKYAILNHVNHGHHRLYLFNYADNRCVEKYVQ